jgi:uncharacterized membrane protein YphA (DoxX/SURF4 family)
VVDVNIFPHIPRLFLGIVFLGAGINGFFVVFGLEPFIPTSPKAMILFQFDYLLIIEKTLEVICGVLLLCNLFIPLVLATLTPIIANIFLLHIFVDPSLLVLAILLVLTHIVMLYRYRNNFKGIFHNGAL